jgi:hypothetical protein
VTLRAFRRVVEDHVDHAGDGVGSVQHEAPSRSTSTRLIGIRRDRGEVHGLRALVHRAQRASCRFTSARAVAARAVDQHQRLVGREVAQRHGAHERRAVGDREALRVERRQ